MKIIYFPKSDVNFVQQSKKKREYKDSKRFQLKEQRIMVYIRINQTILPLMPKKLPGGITYITIDKSKYLAYQDFKQISLQYKLSLQKYLTKSDIISEIDFDRLVELSKRTPEELRAMQELKIKHDFRINSTTSKSQINNQHYYYGNAGQQQGSNNIKELTDSVSFGVTFIFSFFMAGITGYFFGQYFFHFELAGCLILSIIFIFATIFVQTWLYIIKQSKANLKLKHQRKQWQKNQSMKAQYSVKSRMKFKSDTNAKIKSN